MPAHRIVASPTSEGIDFQVVSKPWLGREQILEVDAWSRLETPELAVPIGRLIAWSDEEIATQGGDTVTVPHATIAALTDREARALALPPPPAVQLHVQAKGTIDQPDFKLHHGWREFSGQPVMGAGRTGCWLQIGRQRAYRLPAHMFELVEAIEALNRLASADEGKRWRAWTEVQERLPDARFEGITPDPYLQSFRILHGSAFSIDPATIGGDFDVDPVIFAAGSRGEPDANDPPTEPQPLLAPMQHQHFVARRFRQAERCRPRYTIEDGVYLVLDPGLQASLDVVRRVQLSDRQTRSAFARNPRAFLRDALGDTYDEAVIEELFVETGGYSERVRDIGLWTPSVLPWVSREPAKWFPDQPERHAVGLTVGDRIVPVKSEDIGPLGEKVQAALTDGEASVPYGNDAIPAMPETVEALASLQARVSPETCAPEPEPDEQKPASVGRDGRQVLLIETNYDGVGCTRRLPPRADQRADDEPAALTSTLKPHQEEGLDWLKIAWRAGAPGVLLADDMGLGKTLQGLAFLEWLRRVQRRTGKIEPFLVVAPTGLLGTWVQEHAYHLETPGLGDPLKVWGRALASLRHLDRRGAEIDIGRSVLDHDRLARAPWLLTTYETLRDYQHSLGAVRFAAAVFDETQKIKNPGALATHAAKAVNADFVLGLTGTPVENRLADLWSILDRIHEGFLGDLKSFSSTYEADGAPPERLRELKAKIEQPVGGMPALMLRRMKTDHLEGLPSKTEQIHAKIMPPTQVDAYARAVDLARQEGKGHALRALHAIRDVSLHPLAAEKADQPGFIDASARWQVTFEILAEIAARSDKTLIFLETIELQPVLATMIQRRFGLERQPLIINGQIGGMQRQKRVQAFQNGAVGFDALILGPRAAGLGLTLTAANHVIHLSRWWNPAVEDQCTDRVYRIGQQRPVTVHVPQAIFPDDEASSFDRRLHELLTRKRALSRDLLAPPAATQHDAQSLYNATVGADGKRG